MVQSSKVQEWPTIKELEAELARVKYKEKYRSVLSNTIATLITVAAIAVLVAVLLLPVLQVYGKSMAPTLEEGDILISVKGSKFDTDDVVAFYYNNKILIKRVICNAGDWFDMSENGTVFVNGKEVDEPFLEDKSFGQCDLELPYQVPESRVFVLGDNRSVSVDSRDSSVGCIAEEQIVGKILFRIWPLNRFGFIN